MATSTPTGNKPTRLEIPSEAVRNRPHRSASQRFPTTPFFEDHARNGSYLDVSSEQNDTPHQRLPRAQAPPSLAGPSVRPSIIAPQHRSEHIPLSPFATRSTKDTNEDIHADDLWAEMQRTLADVELSALNASSISHVFGAAHSRALEDLREAQLGLAQAWAKSEADEIAGADNSYDSDNGSESATVGKAEKLTSSPSKHRKTPSQDHEKRRRSRTNSSASASAMSRDLEAETERDIQLARKRREANDRYFQQVNKGVLDVVAKLDDVALAMQRVEQESRDVWDDKSLVSAVSEENATGPERTESQRQQQQQRKKLEEKFEGVDTASLDRVPTRSTATASISEALSDSPVTPKKKGKKAG